MIGQNQCSIRLRFLMTFIVVLEETRARRVLWSLWRFVVVTTYSQEDFQQTSLALLEHCNTSSRITPHSGSGYRRKPMRTFLNEILPLQLV